MSTVLTPLVTMAEVLDLPEDGVERWLIRGNLWEKPMTRRNRWHSRIMTRVAKFLDNWLDSQPEPRGEVLCGEAGCRLRSNPDSWVGIDVVYISAELAAQETRGTTQINGVPTLVVEILSPNDTAAETHEKIKEYLNVGVPLVWVIDPYDKTIRIYRPNQEPALVNIHGELTAEPQLPGFRVAARELFR